MNNELTSATCRLCGRTTGKRQATNHLKSCWERHAIAGPGKRAGRWFHLVVQARHAPDYWLHMQAPGHRAFGELDSVLRRLWLECCDHLSAFEFPVKQPPRPRGFPSDFGAMMAALNQGAAELTPDDDETLMGETLESRLQPGTAFSHQYDFGSTTHLELRVAGEHPAPAIKGEFKLLARNEPRVFACSVCGKPATQFCQECADTGEADLCDGCARVHECGSDALVPLINSPRLGVCGYCGPSVEP
ncbi:MAG: hypothetical protein ABSH34_37865 [Verrucomicrobiota bacterium]